MTAAVRWFTLSVLIVACSLLDAAVPPVKPPMRFIDFNKLPPGTIFIIGEDAKDVLQQPGVIVLTPEKFKEMLDQIDQLKKQVGPDKPDTPSRCRITGKVDGDLVHLQAQFEFETRKRKSLVALGCAKAWPTAASLDDGRLPLLPPPGDDGFVVQVEQPGLHRLTLDLEVPVTPRGAKGTDRGFELGLPRAAITLVESLDVPDNVKDLRFGTRVVPAKDLSTRNPQHKMIALGPVERLDVSWKGPTPQRAVDPILTVQGQIEVRVDDTHVTTEAELLLKPDIGQTAQWQIQAAGPPVTLEVEGAGAEERVAAIVPPAQDAKNPVWTIKLKEPSAEPLKVRLRTRQQRTGKPITVGPFAVPQAVRQYGTITVSVPPDLRPRFRTRGEVSQREVPDDLRRGNNSIAVFTYWNLPPTNPNQPVPAALEIDLETVKGAIETGLTHTLRLSELGWHISTEIDVNPVRTTVERLDVELPKEYEVKASPALVVEPDLEVKDAGKRISTIKLAQKRSQPFKVVLDGFIPLADAKGVSVMPLIRPIGTLDRGAKLSVSVPAGTELLVARDAGTETLPPGKREQAWRADRAPTRVELSWRQHRPDLPVEADVDVTIGERQALVRERLRFLVPVASLKDTVLRALDFPADRLPNVDRVTLTPRGPGQWLITPKDTTLTLDYAIPLPALERSAKSRRLPIPLFWPEAATRCSMKVRVWSDQGSQPVLAGGPWEELPTEVVGDRESLPALVLRGSGVMRNGSLEFPLALSLTEPVGTPLTTVVVERTLIQASVAENGQQSFRARFLLAKVGARSIDIELPLPVSAVTFDVALDGKRITTMQVIDDEGKESDSGRIARLRVEPELYRKPVVLDIQYKIAPGRLDNSRFQTAFAPPRLRGNVLMGRTQWEVLMPTDWVVVNVGGHATPEQRWGLRGGLPALRPAATRVDLERWFNGSDARTGGPEVDPDFLTKNPELVCQQANLEPLTVVHATQQTLLLSCSLVILALGMAVYFAPLRRTVFWSVLAVLVLGVLVALLVWPRPMLVLTINALPGLLVLAIALGAQGVLQRHYRRQAAFMPAFSRLMPGSSIMRGGSSQKRREPSTVDAPPGVMPEGGSGTIRLPGRPPT
ncbi:MAG: hypothetical protein K2R98_03440 [Gemmataceae bacterium]|nr:hypothetical protein [Gemmataceae bacterium]